MEGNRARNVMCSGWWEKQKVFNLNSLLQYHFSKNGEGQRSKIKNSLWHFPIFGLQRGVLQVLQGPHFGISSWTSCAGGLDWCTWTQSWSGPALFAPQLVSCPSLFQQHKGWCGVLRAESGASGEPCSAPAPVATSWASASASHAGMSERGNCVLWASVSPGQLHRLGVRTEWNEDRYS